MLGGLASFLNFTCVCVCVCFPTKCAFVGKWSLWQAQPCKTGEKPTVDLGELILDLGGHFLDLGSIVKYVDLNSWGGC